MHVFPDFSTLLPISSDFAYGRLCVCKLFLRTHTSSSVVSRSIHLLRGVEIAWANCIVVGALEFKVVTLSCWSKARFLSINAHLNTLYTLRHPNITRSQPSRTRTEPTLSRVLGETVEPVAELRISAASEGERDSNALNADRSISTQLICFLSTSNGSRNWRVRSYCFEPCQKRHLICIIVWCRWRELWQQPYEPVRVELAVFFTFFQACFKLPSSTARQRWILPSLADALLFSFLFIFGDCRDQPTHAWTITPLQRLTESSHPVVWFDYGRFTHWKRSP